MNETLIFPARETGCACGTPHRADPCQCEPHPWPIVGSDTCLRCGRYSEFTIAQTWATRARVLALKRRPAKAA